MLFYAALVAIVAGLAKALEVLRIEEQSQVALVRPDMINDRGDLSDVSGTTEDTAEVVGLKLRFLQPLPLGRLVELAPSNGVC